MDGTVMSARQAAQALGTSTPRVLRALADAGIRTAPGRHTRLTQDQMEELRGRLGSTPRIGDLRRTDALIAAALARAPLGLTSVRALARRAGISPTAAAAAIPRLREQGLIRTEERTLPGRTARPAQIIRADYASPAWQRSAQALSRVTPPRSARRDDIARHVPPHLAHLFWNTADAQQDTAQAGGYIARRLIQTRDVEGLAWGAENLRSTDWKHAAHTRGLTTAARALAHNLARSSP
jgi:DNA-binding Lrp family transcriptional regulator